MARITLSVDLPQPPDLVWAELEAVERHVDWMSDAESAEFVGSRTRGVGTVLIVATRVGPFRTRDVIEFTEWDPPSLMGVAHRGLFTGTGSFRLDEQGGGTRMVWSESIRFPWYLGGPIGALVASPVLRVIWRGNLRRFRQSLAGGTDD
jgi:carbon monoxide dehydrogenase subunit G